MKFPYARLLALVGASALGLSACLDLDERVVSGVTADYYETADGLRDAVKATYNGLYSHYAQERHFAMQEYGIDIWAMGADGSHKQWNLYDARLNATTAYANDQWNASYQAINAANAVVTRAAALEGGMDDAEKNRLVAEARFLRALYYFHLVRHYGDVHLTLEETQGVVTEARRTPEAEIYTQAIIPDLEVAINTLPVEPTEYGRATKGAAQHLLALVYLTRQNPGDAAQAEALARAVINSGQYSLQPSYQVLWDINNIENSEMIFTMQSSGDPLTWGSGNRWHLYWNMVYDGEPGMTRTLEYGRPWRRVRPSAFFMDSLFIREADSRYLDSYRFVWLSNFEETQPAGMAIGDTAIYLIPVKTSELDRDTYCNKNYVIFTEPDNFWNPRTRPLGDACPALKGEYNTSYFPVPLKHDDPLRPAVNTEEGRRDFPIYRLADTYLMLAEAIIRQGGDLNEAAEMVNVVRRRAARPGMEAAMEVTAADMTLDFILDERARELYAEGHRWFDLKRFGKLVEMVQRRNHEAKDNIQEHHLLRPIPQSQIDRTRNEDGSPFGQNPGY